MANIFPLLQLNKPSTPTNKEFLYKFIFDNQTPTEYVDGTVYPENTIVYKIEDGNTKLYKVKSDGSLELFEFDGLNPPISGLSKNILCNVDVNIRI